MKKAILPATTLSVVFLAKYIQNATYGFLFDYWTDKELFAASFFLLALSFSLLSVFSILHLTGNFRWNFLVSLTGFALLDASLFAYPDTLWIHLYGFSQILLAIALLTYLYPFHTYTTRKYPAFGAAFLIIYVLLEYSSLIQNQYNLTVFLTYLTITLIMFTPGLYFLFKKGEVAEE